jgi:ATP-dependent exoDNAse (exonuclease V) beta subunit
MNFTVYKASAGAGKTYTLVKEYLKLSLAGSKTENYKNILAITFTNKAAAEMKERVINALKAISSQKAVTGTYHFLLLDLIKETNLSEEQIKKSSKDVLEHMLHNYSDISICTIDKFVHKVIRTFAHDLNLPMNFEIETDEKSLISKAVDLLITKVGIDEELTKVLVDFTETKLNEEKNRNIEQDLKSFAEKMIGEESSEYLDKIRNLSLTDFLSIKEKLSKFITGAENELAEFGQSGLKLIAENNIDHASFAGGANGIGKYFSYLAEKRNDKYSPSATVSKNVSENKWYSGKATATEKAAIDSVKVRLEELFFNAVNLFSKKGADYKLAKLIFRHIHSLMVIREIDLIIAELKKENNIVRISDFNKIIAAIVSNEPAPFIYERLGEKYKHFLIDEFQDTSLLQWQNLLPLLDNSLANGNFNMIVGDGKQSIYRWRGGEVEQFSSLPKIFKGERNPFNQEREEALLRNYKEMPLKQNYRSKREIVEFNNAFFTLASAGLPEELKNVYSSNEQEFNPENTGGYINLRFLNEKVPEIPSFEERTLECVLEIIKENVTEGYALKDIAILFRRNSDASLVANYLISKGVNVISSESLLICNSPKVSFIVDVLCYLTQPGNEAAKTKILKYLIYDKLNIPDEFPAALENVKGPDYKFINYLNAAGLAKTIFGLISKIIPI